MNTTNAFAAFLLELDRAEKLHPNWPKDIVHQAAILAEEVGELIRSANRVRWEDADPLECQEEAVQVGAMCLRFLRALELRRVN
jgi:NTP pyrophosphatase (non-canonical NTP hydrolase)